MINSAADYECVDVSGYSGFISGDIMPVRDGDGTWRQMKFEDVLFLREAYLERLAAAKGQRAASLETPPAFRVERSVLSGTNTAIRDMMNGAATGQVYEFVEAGATLPTGRTGVSAVSSALANLGLSRVVPAGPSTISPPLKADDVRGIFYDIGQCSRLHNKSTLSFTCSGNQENYSGTSTVTHTGTVPFTNVFGSIYTGARSGSRASYSYFNYTSAATADVTIPYAVSAKALAVYSTYANGTWYYDVIPYSCTVVNETVTVPAMSIVAQSVASSLCSAHGTLYVVEGSGATANFNASVSVSAVHVIVELDLPSEIASLNWGWTP